MSYTLPTTVLLQKQTDSKSTFVDSAGLKHLYLSKYEVYDKFTLTHSNKDYAYYESSMYHVVKTVNYDDFLVNLSKK